MSLLLPPIRAILKRGMQEHRDLEHLEPKSCHWHGFLTYKRSVISTTVNRIRKSAGKKIRDPEKLVNKKECQSFLGKGF